MSTRDYAVSVLASLSEKKLKEFIMLFADENTIARMESDLLANDPNSKRYSCFGEFMQADRIEEEFDLAVAEETYKEYIENGEQSRDIAELWKELGI